MYSEFLKFFDKSISYNIYGNDYRTFIIAFGGQRFGKGMFSVFDKGDALVWERRLSKAFPKYKGRFRAFGYDWMGRCFAVPVDNENSILVFDPGVFDVYEISLGLKDFVNKAIPLTTEECLSAGAFVKWSDSTGTDLGRAECVGYKVPLFLGGHDEIDNFEVIGMDEYWEIISQTGRKLHGIEDEEPAEAAKEETVDEDAESEKGIIDEDLEEDMDDEDAYYAQMANEAGDFFEHQKKRAPYIRSNVDKYLEKFKKMYQNDTKASWNWCAFLFGGAWFLYRKLYKCFILVYLISAVVGAALGAGIGLIAGMSGLGMGQVMFFSVIAGIALVLVVMIIVGLFSNHWYSKKIDKLVAMGEDAETEEERERIYKKGGVNIPLLVVYIVLALAASVPTMFL